jgi:hypothetical protein
MFATNLKIIRYIEVGMQMMVDYLPIYTQAYTRPWVRSPAQHRKHRIE